MLLCSMLHLVCENVCTTTTVNNGHDSWHYNTPFDVKLCMFLVIHPLTHSSAAPSRLLVSMNWCYRSLNERPNEQNYILQYWIFLSLFLFYFFLLLPHYSLSSHNTKSHVALSLSLSLRLTRRLASVSMFHFNKEKEEKK